MESTNPEDTNAPSTSGNAGQLEGVILNMMNMFMEETRRRDAMTAQLLDAVTANTTAPTVMVLNAHEGEKSISIYDGKQDAALWLKSLTTQQALQKWPDKHTFEVARSHLAGGPLDWWHEHSDLQTFAEFEAAFRRTFVIAETFATKWKRMEAFVQQKDQDLTDYFHHKSRLCSDLKLTSAEKKEQIVIGLYDQQLCIAMTSKFHPTMDDLYHDMLEYVRIQTAREERIFKHRTSTFTPANARQVNVRSNALTNMQSLPSKPPTANQPPRNSLPPTTTVRSHSWNIPTTTSPLSDPKCFNCNKLGHLARDCPSPLRPRTCTICKTVGHAAAQCTSNQNAVNVIRATNNDAILKYLKTITCNESTMEGFVDPGSSECTMKASCVIASGFAVQLAPLQLKAFGPAHHVVTSPGVVTVDVALDGVQLSNVPFRVVPDDVQSLDVIIGRTFTEHPDIVYLRIDDDLLFSYRQDDAVAALEVDELRKSSTRTSHPTTIPPRSVGFVQAVHDVMTLQVPLFNASACPIKVKRNTTLMRGNVCELQAIDAPRKGEITQEVINVEDDLDDDTKEDLRNLLNEFRDTIAADINELGCTHLIEMEINERPDSQPVRQKPYKASSHERKSLNDIISGYRDAGLITDTASPYASPVLLVKKKSGENRMVVDYRRLNSQTESMPFPLPNKTTNKTPFQVVFGYHPRIGDGTTRLLTQEEESYENPQLVQEKVREQLRHEKEKYKERFDAKRVLNVSFDVGDIVYMQTQAIGTGESTKLQRRFRGPLEIVETLPGDTYRVVDLNQDEGGRVYATTAHVSQLKGWNLMTEDDTLPKEVRKIPTTSSVASVESNTLPLPCPLDSTPGDDGKCVCDRSSCEEPFCDKHLIQISDFTDTPGHCCPTYSCDACPADFPEPENCPCKGDTFLNADNVCECASREKSLIKDVCICDESKCPPAAQCDVHSVPVKTIIGCCHHVECKVCPFDSHPTNYSDDRIEDKCVCSLCTEPECPVTKYPILEKKGNQFPGSCCNSYICVNSNETCLSNDIRHANGDTWHYDGEKYECRGGVATCISCVGKSCIHNGTSYGNNETWYSYDNEKCNCRNGISLCSKDPLEPVEISCSYDGQIYSHMSSWIADSCNNCTCYAGKTKCIADLCKMIIEEIKTTPDCPPLTTCRKACDYGYKLNKYGCEICKCKQPRPYGIKCKYPGLQKVIEINDLDEDIVIGVIKEYLRQEHTSTTTTTTTEIPVIKDHCDKWWAYMIIGMGIMLFIFVLIWMVWTICCNKESRSISFGKDCKYEMQPFRKEKYISAT